MTDYASRLTGMQTEVGLQRLVPGSPRAAPRTASPLRLIPKPDKYYLLEIIDDPRGLVEVQVVQNNPPGSGQPVVQTQKITRETFKISAQFAKRYYFTTLRFGLIESTGGVGADLHFLKDALELKLDAFNFSAEELRYPRLRATLRAQAFEHLFVIAGMDDILNAQQRDTATNA